MILGFDINYLIKVVLGIVALYGLTLLAVGVFMGWGKVKTILRYTTKFWWIILAAIAFLMISKRLKGKQAERDEVTNKIKEIEKIEVKTKKDNQELKRLEGEKKKVEEEIKTISDDYKSKLDKLKEKPSNPDDVKPGDASNSSDAMNDAWK